MNQILQFQECQPTGKMMSIFSDRFKKIRQWIFRREAQESAVVISTKYNDRRGWDHCVDVFIRVVKQTDIMHIVPVGAIVRLAHSVRETIASYRIHSVWLVNNQVDLNTYWTEY